VRHRSHSFDPRGNTHDRRVRRDWLLSAQAGFGGNGRTVPCFHCGKKLRKPTVDRFPICGHDGGRYTRDNIVPACTRCNFGRHARGRCAVVRAVAA
jgi:hypothetical protein